MYSEWSRRFSPAAHVGLYVLMFITPIVGAVTFIWHGRVFDFGLFLVDFAVRKNRAIFEPTEDIHGYQAYALFALAGVHALAALWHQFIAQDGLLRRMHQIPFATVRSTVRLFLLQNVIRKRPGERGSPWLFSFDERTR